MQPSWAPRSELSTLSSMEMDDDDPSNPFNNVSSGLKRSHSKSKSKSPASSGKAGKSTSLPSSKHARQASKSAAMDEGIISLDESRHHHSSSSNSETLFGDAEVVYRESDSLLPNVEPLPSALIKSRPRTFSIGESRGAVPPAISTRPQISPRTVENSTTSPRMPTTTKPMGRTRSDSSVGGIFTPANPTMKSPRVVPTAATDELTPRHIEEELASIMTAIPELTLNTNEKQFTMTNVYFNLKRDLAQQHIQMQRTIDARLALMQDSIDLHLRATRQNQVGLLYTLTDISRGGVFTMANSNIVPIREPRSEESYKKSKSENPFLSCFGY